MTRKHTLPPNPARLIEGLRDTGYNFNTALADIIDNSVDAGATEIDVRINMDPDGDIIVTVADNGCGMDEPTLLDGMTYGAQGRVDPKRLGKFGMGLKTASTAFCRKLSVVTRNTSDSELIKATWDLDHVGSVADWQLLIDSPTSYEKELLNEVSAESSGTLVIWEKVDRLMKNYSDSNGKPARKALEKVIANFKDHAAMVYQRFLNEADTRAKNIKITLNGQIVPFWDPFCENENETELVAEKILKQSFLMAALLNSVLELLYFLEESTFLLKMKLKTLVLRTTCRAFTFTGKTALFILLIGSVCSRKSLTCHC